MHGWRDVLREVFRYDREMATGSTPAPSMPGSFVVPKPAASTGDEDDETSAHRTLTRNAGSVLGLVARKQRTAPSPYEPYVSKVRGRAGRQKGRGS